MTSSRRKASRESNPPIRQGTGPAFAIYHRVSTLDQDETLARAELEAYVARQGGHVALCEEESASGAWNERPGLQRVLGLAKRRKIDAVVVWKLDRWGRSALDVLANIRALTDAGVRFVAYSQGLDVKPDGDPMSKLMITMLAAIAEFERDLIKERTRLGMEKARERGVVFGRPRGEGPELEQVRALRGQGLSWAQVAQQLNCTIAMARRRAS